jgi:type I restriction enzyme M protein
MYLHQFKNPKIIQYDSLSQDEFWHDKFDIILANPPFMSPKGGIKPHSKFSIPSNRSEVLFVDYIINHLKPNGRSGIIVPEGIIFQSGTAYKNLRKNLINDGLYAVISLPSGVFQPYSGVKTSILLIDKEFAKKSNEILFIKIENDGFDLGAQRRAINKNDLPQALEILQKFRNYLPFESPSNHALTDLNNSPLEGESQSVSDAVGGQKPNSNFNSKSKNFLLVPKSKIAENGDYNLSGDRYRVANDYSKAKWEMVELGEVCELVRGITYSKNDEVDYDGHKVLRAMNISLDCKLVLNDIKQISKNLFLKDNQKLKENDIFICLASGSKDHIGKVAFIEKNEEFYFGGFMGAIRVLKNRISSRFLYSLLKNEKFNDYLREVISGANINNLSGKILNNFKIPLPPLEIQEQIVSEIDGYSSIIAGAKQIVTNWKPKIDIDPSWEKVKLGDICDVFGGGTPSRAVDEYWGGDIPWLSARYFSDEHKIKGSEMITKEGLRNSSSKIAPKDSTILITRVSVGKFAIADQDYAINQDLTALVPKSKNLDNKYLWIISELVAERIKNNAVGIGVNGVTRDFVINEEIPLPPLETQQQIVSQIEAEQALVESAKKLIEIYEQKTKAVIKKLWEE